MKTFTQYRCRAQEEYIGSIPSVFFPVVVPEVTITLILPKKHFNFQTLFVFRGVAYIFYSRPDVDFLFHGGN